MAKIFLAENTDYVVACDMDQAVEKYYEDRSKYPNEINLFKDDGFVITESTVVEITTGVIPTLADTDGALVSPTPNVFIKEGDSITLVAVPSIGYPTFVRFEDGSATELSTSNPFTYVAGASNISINAVFST